MANLKRKSYGGWTCQRPRAPAGKILAVYSGKKRVFHTEQKSHGLSDPSTSTKSRIRAEVCTRVAIAHYAFHARLPFDVTEGFLWYMYFLPLEGPGIGDPGSGINPQGGSRGCTKCFGRSGSQLLRYVEMRPVVHATHDDNRQARVCGLFGP